MPRKPGQTNQRLPMGWDFRRAIFLVQCLAQDGSDAHIRHLCASWGIEPEWDYSETYQGEPYLNVWATIRKLAQHCIDHARAERSESNFTQGKASSLITNDPEILIDDAFDDD